MYSNFQLTAEVTFLENVAVRKIAVRKIAVGEGLLHRIGDQHRIQEQYFRVKIKLNGYISSFRNSTEFCFANECMSYHDPQILLLYT